MKKNLKFWSFVAAAVFGAGLLMSATYWQLMGDKEKALLDMVTEGMRKMHFSPEKMNDEYSARVYDIFLKDTDPSKLFYTQKDTKKFEKYEKSIDDEIQNMTFDFYNLVANTRTERIAQCEKIYKEILDKPFEFTKDEEYEADDDKRGYAADDAALRDLWRKYLKFQVLSRLSDMIDDQEKAKEKKDKKGKTDGGEKVADPSKTDAPKIDGAKTDAPKIDGAKADAPKIDGATDKKEVPFVIKTEVEMEAEARKKVLKVHDDWFKRLKELKPEDMYAVYLNSITTAYDPHSNYMAPEQKKDFDINMSGKLEGIGATLQAKDSYIRVTSLVLGSPAWKTGKLKVDDLILKVAQGSGEPVDLTDMSINEAIKMIRGKKGTEVRLTIKKTDGTVVVVPIIRDIVELEDGFAKSSMIENEGMEKIGYIDLPRFYADFEDRNGRKCSRDMEVEVKKLITEGAKGIIIDLRGNGGGSLNDVVEIGGLFINKGPIVQVKSREGKPEQLNDYKPGTVYDGPLVIMTDQYSASASEILAAAMQDYGRAVIVGGKSTFGKGTVQRFFDLDLYVQEEFKNLRPLGSVKLTTQKFYRIDGTTTQLQGVIPDVILPDSYAYIDKYGEKSESYPLKWDEIAPATYKKAEGLSGIMANIKKASETRVSKDKHFNLIREGAKRLKEQRDKTKYSLSMKGYTAAQKALELAAKPLRDSNNDMITGVKVSTLKVDEERINLD
ncbi:MAG: hypothetical protein RI894_1261, partial [Bacteroidota bacterium]